MTSDETTRSGKRPNAAPGPGMCVRYKCDFCRQQRSVAEGRKRVNGVFWRCQHCAEKKQ